MKPGKKRLPLLSALLPGLCAMTLAWPGGALAALTPAPYVSTIQVVNNPPGTPDTVTVSDLAAGDLVKVYANPSTTATLATGTVSAGLSSVAVPIAQLGTTAGTVYVSVTSGTNGESHRTAKSYAAEPASAALNAAQIAVVNNPSGTADTITVENLTAGQVIKVYTDPVDSTAAGTATVASGQTGAVVSVAQLGSAADYVYVTVTGGSLGESLRTAKAYAAEQLSPSPAVTDIAVVNNVAGTSDRVTVKNVSSGDVIRLYAGSLDTTAIASVTASSATATLTVAQLGQTSGYVYVSRTRGTMAESRRAAKSYKAEKSSVKPSNAIRITNNAGSADILTIAGLQPSDYIRVYATAAATSPLAVATANVNLLPPVSQWNLHASASPTSAYTITLAATAAGQSSYFAVPVLGGRTYTASIGTFTGTVNLTEYSGASSTSTRPIAASNGSVTWTVAAATTHVRFEVASAASGTFTFNNPMLELGATRSAFERQASVQSKNLLPPLTDWALHANAIMLSDYSLRLNATASGQGSTARVRANASTAYTFSATHNGQVTIALYNAFGTLISTPFSGTAARTGTFTTTAATAFVEMTLTSAASGSFNFSGMQLEAGSVATAFEAQNKPLVTGTVSIAQLGAAAGTVYITITSSGSLESARAARSYPSEARSKAPVAGAIRILNNKVGANDKLSVTGLSAGDIVNVYAGKQTPAVYATATVAAGSTTAVLYVAQLGVDAGTLYFTVTQSGKSESVRVAKSYLKE